MNESMVGLLCYGLEEPNVFEGFSLQTDKLKCYMGDTGLLLSLASEGDYIKNAFYKSFVLGKLSTNKGMMTENLIAQIFASTGKQLRFYETYSQETREKTGVEKNKIKNKKYEVDFLIMQNKKTTPIEVKS